MKNLDVVTFFVCITALIVMTLGDPDIIDGIVHSLMRP
jgi:hypothetical protein